MGRVRESHIVAFDFQMLYLWDYVNDIIETYERTIIESSLVLFYRVFP